MNTSETKSANVVANKNVLSVIWLILICLGWTVAISNHSFWLDEAHGAGWKARQSTLAEWWNDDFAQPQSTDSQIPLYVFYIWVYAKIFGSGEWILRAANLPFILFGFWALHKSFGQNPLKWPVAIAAASSPFLWYYLNEARPYAMQVGSSFLIAGALQQLYKNSAAHQSRAWMAALSLGLIGLSGSNLLGQIWAGAAVATALFIFGWQQTKTLVQRHWLLCATTSVALIGLGIYYLWTLQSGSRATSVGTTTAKNLVFVLYELFGFSGLGPGRLEIRDHGLTSFRPYVGWLGAYAIVLTPIIFVGLRYLFHSVPRRILGFTFLFFGIVSCFLAYVGIFSQFRLLGRHFAPILFLLLYVLGMGILRMWISGNMLKKICVIAFVALSFVSCFLLRFDPRHAKDDYRAAANLARAALQNGKIVWWNANYRAAGYYRLAIRRKDSPALGARFFANPEPDELAAASKPGIVICSKPDIFDASGTMFRFLRAENFQVTTNFPAFTVWEKVSE